MNIFPIFNPITLDIIDFKPRINTHTSGLWHKGVDAHIIRKNKQGTFDLYLQKRSSQVDISRNKLDQSVATQMLASDNNDENNTLRRGLYEELRISNYTSVRLPFNMRIIKKYKQFPNLLNCEIISLYLVKSMDEPDYKHCQKIQNGYWMEWNHFQSLFDQNSDTYTKSSQMYLSIPEIRKYIIENSYRFLASECLTDFVYKDTIFTGYFSNKVVVFKTFKSKDALAFYLTNYDHIINREKTVKNI